MLSAVIPSERSKPAVLLAEQLAHQRFVRPGPLVLGTAPLKSPTRTADRDRTVSRRSKPSSRTALMGEQPNPWDRLQPQDATSRHRTFSAVFQQRRLYLHPARPKARGRRVVAVMNLPLGTNCHRGCKPQSLRGHLRKPLQLLVALPTDFPRYRPPYRHKKWRRLGVHRYKPIPLRHLCRFTPI